MATYTVLPGDNLTKIAAHLTGMSGPVLMSYVDALVALNNIPDKDKIFIGQKLIFPDEWAAKPVRPVPIPTPKPVAMPPPRQSFWQNPVVIGALIIGTMLFLSRR